MESAKVITADQDLKTILSSAATIAIIGLSPKPERDSNQVARYLLRHGYRVLPVHPVHKTILDQKAYRSLADIDVPVDIVTVFRRSSQILPHAREALEIRPRIKTFWMQLAIENQAAADLLTAQGVDVVMNRCIKVEHGRLNVSTP